MATTEQQSEYLFIQDEAEDQRLRAQSDVLDEFTAELFDQIGFQRGWRVLDLGCGAGNVSLLAAERVGPEGTVVAVDRDPATVERAQADMAGRGITNIDFRVADAQSLDGVEGDFDAVVGRLVYMYLPDPVEGLRQAYQRLRPGGLIFLQETDLANVWAEPMTPLWQQTHDWLQSTMELAGVEARMGFRLFPIFRAAGLPDPDLGVQWTVRPCDDLPGYTWADIVNGVAPLMEKLGVATREQLGPETLRERLTSELLANDGIMMIGPFFNACATKPLR